MNRTRRPPAPKSSAAGEVYDPSVVKASSAVTTNQVPAAQPRNYSYQNTPKKSVSQTAVPNHFPIEEAPVENNEGEDMVLEDENESQNKGKALFKKIFLTRKKSSVRAKEKKIRQNRALRKVILPKNALMALNEVKGITISDFLINSNVGGGFTAVVSVNDNQYEGKGPSKVFAKNNACEKALRDFVLAKMRQKPRLVGRTQSVAADDAMDTTDDNAVVKNGSAKSDDDDIDDVPMINLASFALYKLFSEWESEGYEIPEFHPSAAQPNANESDNGPAKEPKKPTIRTELPPNWELIHPATLLCMMRPGLTYTHQGVVGDNPNNIQRFSVITDDKEFVGEGRSKKIAKRNTAAIVCNSLFDTNFPETVQAAT